MAEINVQQDMLDCGELVLITLYKPFCHGDGKLYTQIWGVCSYYSVPSALTITNGNLISENLVNFLQVGEEGSEILIQVSDIHTIQVYKKEPICEGILKLCNEIQEQSVVN